MKRDTKQLVIFSILSLLLLSPLAYLAGTQSSTKNDQSIINSIKNAYAAKPSPSPIPPTPTQKVYEFSKYTPPQKTKKSEYKIFMLGDSMTDALGPHGGEFSENINLLYKKNGIGIIIDNYASPSSNILSLDQNMRKEIRSWDVDFKPMLDQDFDLVLIESFGYNPLSQFGITDGIKEQNTALGKTLTTIINNNPEASIVFVATIAPDKQTYNAANNPGSTIQERTEQADERIIYLKNHISYAKFHNIPVVNIFEKSLSNQGDGNTKYINPDDNIHPSAVGIELISKELADFIYNNQILPY